jgi:molybdopterin converting factor small subunit
MLTNSVGISRESAVAVPVRIPTILRPDAGGQSVVEVDGETVGEIFSALVTQFPNLKDKLVTEEGELHKFVNVYVNDDDVRYLDKLDTKVGPADTISILPAVAGG